MKTRHWAAPLAVLLLTAAAACTSTPPSPSGTPASSSVTATAGPVDKAVRNHHEDEDSVGTATSAPPPNAGMLAALTYVRRWARPAMNHADWYAALRPLVTPGYASLLADTDPAQVPARSTTGPPTPVSSTTAVLVTDVPTDAGAVRVTVVNTAGRWLIATAEPAAETVR
ncbi:hypothetical protein ACFY36_50585 [Actinoplanes sp. NPDC000266]